MGRRDGVGMAGAVALVGGLLLCACGAGGDDDTGDDDDTCGYEPMDVRIFHRAAADVCPDTRDPVWEVPSECVDYPDTACSSHEDCTEGSNGRCTMGIWGTRDCECSYDECFSDTDCGAGFLCGCGEQAPFENLPNNRCVSAGCRTDADCDAGYCMAVPYYCDAPASVDDLWIESFVCATDFDECRNHEACTCDDELAVCRPESAGEPWTCGRGYMWDCD